MSTYSLVRGKTVTLGRSRFILAVNDDGSRLTIRVGRQLLDLSEADASQLFDLLGDVMTWESAKGTTEAKSDKRLERDEADMESGKMDDTRAQGTGRP